MSEEDRKSGDIISYKDCAAVKRLALEYRMQESCIRQMLAIESGEISGDVIEVPDVRECGETSAEYPRRSST